MSLQQTQPGGNAAVCPLDTVGFTCEATAEMQLRDLGTGGFGPVEYNTLDAVGRNDTTGIFKTELVANNGTRLTATATVDSAQPVGHNGKRLRCREIIMDMVNQKIANLTVAGG